MKYLVFLTILCLLLLGCQSFRDQPLSEQAQANVASNIDTAHFGSYVLSSRASVKAFYKKQAYYLHWIDKAQLKPSADSLVSFITRAGRMGLIPQDYHAAELQRLLSDTLSTDRYSKIDLLLTDAYLTLCNHIRQGRLDPRTYQRLDFAADLNSELIASLEKIHSTSITQILSTMEPTFFQYHELKKMLTNFSFDRESDTTQRERAVKIALNMERWRWKRKVHDRFVSVNIPAFVLRVFEKDSLWLETKVIVGKRATPTPVMESVIRSFVIYPYWHVPRSISTREILPALQNDASYLRINNFDVLNKSGQVILPDTIQWDLYKAEYFPFILRQREGSENSMGIIKFIFDNNYGVYLHDTNSKRLFAQTKRDLSHGCVRVNNAVAFAHYLIREDDIYVSPDDLDQYLTLQQRLTIELRKPIPVLLEYFTAEVRDGVSIFYEDIYKRDSVMISALYPPVHDPLLTSAPAGL